MKCFFALVATIAAACFTSAASAANHPNQPAIIPATGEYGAYATQSQLLDANDPDLAKAYDNFTLDADFIIDGFNWAGVYAEPLPASPADTDFIVQIWKDGAGVPDLGAGPMYTFNFEGGTAAGTGGPDLTVTALGHTSPSTDATPGGGEAFGYSGGVADAPLSAGNYWISILANQLFTSPEPIVDPEWQWHVGDGPKDGFYSRDRTLDPAGTPDYGILQDGKDLAFEITGQVVPEPNAALLGLLGLVSLGLVRRRR